jgi:hypothetical protein
MAAAGTAARMTDCTESGTRVARVTRDVRNLAELRSAEKKSCMHGHPLRL